MCSTIARRNNERLIETEKETKREGHEEYFSRIQHIGI